MPINKIASVVLLVVIGLFFLYKLFKYDEVAAPDGWPGEIVQSSNAIRGNLRVEDRVTGTILFYYSVDPAVRPVAIEKTGEDTWVVTFKK